MSGTAVWFGAVDRAYRIRRPLTPRVWTCVGALAIPLWAVAFLTVIVLAGFLSRTSTVS